MDDVLVFDLETASSEENPGIFETYAVGWRTSTESGQLIAETQDDLKGGLLQRFLDLLKTKGAEVAAQGNEEDVRGKTQPRYLQVYAYNGSRFDNLAIMHTILSNSDAELPHDMLETNGKLILTCAC